MDTLHTVLRAIRGETKSRTHLAVFREFLNHLDRAAKRAVKREEIVKPNGNGRTNGKHR
jgi:sugar-specific transcriptional regulator TrmB